MITGPDVLRLHRVMELVGDPRGKRILDLACGVAWFSTALAMAGADVVGIEGRQENLDMAPVSKARLELGDVRALPATLGRFDVVLCLGIFYHLTAEAAVALLSNLRAMTERVIVDTHVAGSNHSTVVGGGVHTGQTYPEPDSLWSSLDLQPSWWFTPESLVEVFRLTGWAPSEVPGASYPGEPLDRRWYVLDGA